VGPIECGVAGELRKHRAEVPLAEHREMIKTLPAKGTDDPLRDRVRPRGPSQHRREAGAGDYRSTTNRQFESLLEQAGRLAPARLGGTSPTGHVAARGARAPAPAADGPPPRA
jgi:hypothetical protein